MYTETFPRHKHNLHIPMLHSALHSNYCAYYSEVFMYSHLFTGRFGNLNFLIALVSFVAGTPSEFKRYILSDLNVFEPGSLAGGLWSSISGRTCLARALDCASLGDFVNNSSSKRTPRAILNNAHSS